MLSGESTIIFNAVFRGGYYLSGPTKQSGPLIQGNTINFVSIPYSPPKFATLSEVNISSLEAIRAEMDKNIEGDEYLDYLGETLEQRRNLRAVSLDASLD